MEAAMSEVRDTMGPDAIIISSHESPRGRGVEVRAAIEDAALNRQAVALDDTPSLPIDDELESRLRRDLMGKMKNAIAQQAKQPVLNPSLPDVDADPGFEENTQVQMPPVSDENGGWVKTGVAGIVKGAPTPKAPKGKNSVPANPETNFPKNEESPWSDRDLMDPLAYHCVPDNLANELLSSARTTDAADAGLALGSALDMRYPFEPLPAAPRRAIILVGAPGVGKTVTTAKLAARCALEGFSPVLITTDTLRSGAIEQLQSFADILKSKVLSAENPEDLAKLVAAHEGEPIFIDTPATNPFSRAELKDLERFIQACGAEPVWIAAADANPMDIKDQASTFASLGVRRLITTRIDATRRLGGMITAVESAKLAFAQVSITPYVAQGLNAINPLSLARLLTDMPDQPDETETSRKQEPAPRRKKA